MKKIYSMIVAIGLVFSMLLLTACPSQNSIEKAAKASNQLSSLTLNAVRTTKTAYETNLLTTEQKDVIADKLLKLSQGGVVFNDAVKNLKNVYQSGNLPPDQFTALSALFDTSIITPFLSLLQDFKLIKNAPAVIAAIEVIRTSVLQIAAVFGKQSIIPQKVVMTYG